MPNAAAAQSRPRAPRSLVAAVIVLVLACAGLAAVAVAAAGGGGDGERTAIEDVASASATALLTYDYRDLAASRARVDALASASFRKQFDTSFESTLRQTLTSSQATSEARAKEVFVTRVHGRKAAAIVVTNAVASAAGHVPTGVDAYVRLDLVKVGADWRVDAATNLAATQASGGPGGSPTPVPTTGAGPATAPTASTAVGPAPAATAPAP